MAHKHRFSLADNTLDDNVSNRKLVYVVNASTIINFVNF